MILGTTWPRPIGLGENSYDWYCPASGLVGAITFARASFAARRRNAGRSHTARSSRRFSPSSHRGCSYFAPDMIPLQTYLTYYTFVPSLPKSKIFGSRREGRTKIATVATENLISLGSSQVKKRQFRGRIEAKMLKRRYTLAGLCIVSDFPLNGLPTCRTKATAQHEVVVR